MDVTILEIKFKKDKFFSV